MRLAAGSGFSVMPYVSLGHWPAATAASCAGIGILLDVGSSFKEGQYVLDFGLQELVNRREAATGVAARYWSTAATHATEGGTGTGAGIGTGNGAAETFVCTCTGTGACVNARAGACAGRCTDACKSAGTS